MKFAVFTDSDNTLWDTDRVYADAQRWLVDAVSSEMQVEDVETDSLEFLRKYDQAIAIEHHAGLRYPPRLLVRALTLGLSGIDPTKAARMVWAGSPGLVGQDKVNALETTFLSHLEDKPVIRPGVNEGLELLARLSLKPIVVTEGPKSRCEDYLQNFGLTEFVSGVHEAKKTVDLYKRLLRLSKADQAFMIGDQLDRDIWPAEEAGISGILFPGGFRPEWVDEQRISNSTRVVTSYLEAVSIIEKNVLLNEQQCRKRTECN